MDSCELQDVEIQEKDVDFVITAIDHSVQKNAMKIAAKLREKFVVDFDLMNRKLGKVLGYADNINAKFVVIVGPREIKENKVSIRNVKTKEQKVVGIDEIGTLVV